MKTVTQRVAELKDEIHALAHGIHEDPELGLKEYHASAKLTDLLEKYGFSVKKNISGMETAFVASYKGSKPGPVIGFLAEYDALVSLGHACGHNMIGSLACCCGIALREAIDEYGGEVRVIGCPAEETLGAKMQMSEDGIFDGLTVAMMGHPFGRHAASGIMYAIDSIRFEFFGKATHAADVPLDELNALDAVIDTFNGINALKKHLLPTARISGIVREGGKAANIIPDYTCCEFYTRADNTAYLCEFTKQVRDCGLAAARAAGVTVKITNFEGHYDNLNTNSLLSARAVTHTKEAGVTQPMDPYNSSASSDIGNVSYRCPAIHQWFDVTGNPDINLHTKEFACCTDSEYGYEQMFLVAEALVATAEDVLTDPEFVRAIREEFEKTTTGFSYISWAENS